MKRLSSETMASKFDIPLHGPSVNIVRQFGPALSDILQRKFGCAAVIEGVDFEGDLTTAWPKRPNVVPVKRFSITLHAGVKVSVCKADLTSFPVDAVVNAANTSLQHYGGLAQALSSAGGPKIQAECNDYITKNGKLKTGDAVVTDAWLLPCKKIIHAVGPQLQPKPNSSDCSLAQPKLKQSIWSILNRVKENRLKTVAIPAISSGLFNFPLPLCAKTIVSAVKEYYENSSSQGFFPEEIFLVNNDEPSVKEMESACQKILAPQHMSTSYSQAAAAKTSTPPVEIGNVLLTLKQGKIEDQSTDVIVNNSSSDRDLQAGTISRAFLQKAGPALQSALYNARVKGHVAVTKAYNLLCQELYHTFCIDKEKKAAQQILYQSVLECLQLAAASHHMSISFPAIGTGGLRFNNKEAARIMLSAINDFAWNSSKMMEVYFVILPSKSNVFKAFEEEIRFLQSQLPHASFTKAFEHRDDFRDKPPTPKISLSGPSDETMHEAERWLNGLLGSTGIITICNNFILHLGEKEYLQLHQLTKKGLLIEESFRQGHADITVKGGSYEDVAVAGLQVEAMLCNIQKEFIRGEKEAMYPVTTENESFERKAVDCEGPVFLQNVYDFKKERLQVIKLEKVENSILKRMFELKKNQLQSKTSQKMFQRIPAQFCEMVSHIGFHTECAPPTDPAYGDGIYFARTVRKAMEVWREQKEEYLYFVEAEVLTGKSAPGKPGLILPPAMGTDPQILYDSVSGGADIAVIFSSYQALPMSIITCKVV